VLRELNISGKRLLPQDAPTAFVKPRWPTRVFEAEGALNRHFYELCVLSELLDRLRSGDVWVRGSREYRDFETYLIPAETFEKMLEAPLPLSGDTDLAAYLGERAQSQQTKMDEVAEKARRSALPDVSIEAGSLRITPLKKTTPATAIEFAEQAYRLMPHVKITELLARWIGGQAWSIGSFICEPWRRLSTARHFSRPCWPTVSILASSAWPRPAVRPVGGN
jgi:hypothetical protein